MLFSTISSLCILFLVTGLIIYIHNIKHLKDSSLPKTSSATHMYVVLLALREGNDIYIYIFFFFFFLDIFIILRKLQLGLRPVFVASQLHDLQLSSLITNAGDVCSTL